MGNNAKLIFKKLLAKHGILKELRMSFGNDMIGQRKKALPATDDQWYAPSVFVFLRNYAGL